MDNMALNMLTFSVNDVEFTGEQVVQLAVDSYKGIPTQYSADMTNDTLRKALIVANNGKDHLDKRDLRDGKCGAVFAIIEEIITKTVIDGLQGNEFFMNMVEYRNLALGDTNEFYTPDDSYFRIAEISRGNTGIRRQRLNGGTHFTVGVKTYGAKIYEEIDRVLSGRVSLNDMIARVGDSIKKEQYEEIFKAWTAITTPTGGGNVYIPATGSYSESALLELCEHVEVNNDTTPIIMGTREALRKVTTAVVSEEAKKDLYNIGYYGNFNGIPMVRIKQIHKHNTNDFLLPNNQLYIVGADVKPIKYVTEGNSFIDTRSNADNADLTQEYLITYNAGISVILPDKKIGVYTMS